MISSEAVDELCSRLLDIAGSLHMGVSRLTRHINGLIGTSDLEVAKSESENVPAEPSVKQHVRDINNLVDRLHAALDRITSRG